MYCSESTISAFFFRVTFCSHSALPHCRIENCEEIVAEAVSAVRTLLQAKVFGEQQPAVVATVAALLPSIALPLARASVLWCVGNHCEQLPLVAPDVLRTTLARFADEAPAVRLQALDLAARCAAHGLKKSSEMRLWSGGIYMSLLSTLAERNRS